MNLLEYYNFIDKKEIDRFVEEAQEENLNLEFKTVNHPNLKDINFDKKNISKVISGFANSTGGIVIWGVKAEKNESNQDVASKLKPINELTSFLNMLNRLEGQSVTPMVSGIHHEKIEIEADCGFVKTYIPKSESAPHMALYADKHYYKRSGDSFYQCEHFDIADMFSRRKSSSLKLKYTLLEKDLIHQTQYRYNILISIINEGQAAAKFPSLALNLIGDTWMQWEFGLDGSKATGLNRVKNMLDYKFNYIGGSDIIIYPGMKMDIDRFYFKQIKSTLPGNLTIQYQIDAENCNQVIGKIEIESDELLLGFRTKNL